MKRITSLTAAFVALCIHYAQPAAYAQGPDLIGSVDDVVVLHDQEVSRADVIEGCAEATTGRSLVRFSLTTHNVGDMDIVIGDPQCPDCSTGDEPLQCGNPLFMCSAADGHGHGHMKGFADYRVVDPDTGETIVTGHKEGFCMRDNVCEEGLNVVFNCENQGISAGCADIYSSDLGCQYVDITDLPPGDYILRATVNDAAALPETNYDNNTVEVRFTMTDPGDAPDSDPEPDSDDEKRCEALDVLRKIVGERDFKRKIRKFPLHLLSGQLHLRGDGPAKKKIRRAKKRMSRGAAKKLLRRAEVEIDCNPPHDDKEHDHGDLDHDDDHDHDHDHDKCDEDHDRDNGDERHGNKKKWKKHGRGHHHGRGKGHGFHHWFHPFHHGHDEDDHRWSKNDWKDDD